MVDKLISDLADGTSARDTEIEILLDAATTSVRDTLADVLGLVVAADMADLNTSTVTFTNKTVDADSNTASNFEIGNEVPTALPTVITADIWFPAPAWSTRTTNGAEYATLELATNDVMLQSFNFDQTTEEGVGMWWHPPDNWDAGTITFQTYWTAASGTATNTFICGLSGRSYTNSDALDQAPETGVQTTTDAFITANDMHISAESSAITITNATVGEAVYLEMTRNISDTMDADCKVIGIRVRYSINDVASS